jgi:ubiquinone/menaquinone biosynthesis C-methylase UbiE
MAKIQTHVDGIGVSGLKAIAGQSAIPVVSAIALVLLFTLLFTILGFTPPLFTTDGAIALETATYEYRKNHDPDGIGKFYQGREIARVMGHEGASWLERTARLKQERTDRAVKALHLRPTDQVADLGAGTGYFSVRMAAELPQGQVYAVDLQPEMLDYLNQRQQQFPNLIPIQGSATNPNLPANRLDLALLVDAYHEFEFPQEMMQGVVQALKPKGRVVLLEYRAENPLVLIKPLHKMSQQQVKTEMAAVGLTWQATVDRLPQQHLMIFQKW